MAKTNKGHFWFNGGFLDSRIHVIPAGAVEVTRSQRNALLSSGKQIVEVDGFPTVGDFARPGPEQLVASIKAERAALLTEADHAINKAVDAGGDATAWREYRQQLRDLTKQPSFPATFTWPTKP